MPYLPFAFSDHPKIAEDLEAISRIPAAAKNVLSFSAYGDYVLLALKDRFPAAPIRVSFDPGEYAKLSLTERDKNSLYYSLKELESAEVIDGNLSSSVMASEWAVVRAFRSVNQKMGGYRYVHYCGKLVETNLNHCLYPYMYPYLIGKMAEGYNKVISHDTPGLADGLIDYISSLEMDGEDVVTSVLGSYRFFNASDGERFIINALSRLDSASLASAVAECSASGGLRREIMIALTLPIMEALPLTEACFALENGDLPFLERAGYPYLQKHGETESVQAFLKNPLSKRFDVRALPCFDSLPIEVKKALDLQGLFVGEGASKRVIDHYLSLADQPVERARFATECRYHGFGYIVDALEEATIVINGFRVEDLPLLLPHMKSISSSNMMKLTVVLSREAMRLGKEKYSEIVLCVDRPEMKAFVAGQLRGDRLSRYAALTLAKRYDLLEELHVKEWH